LAAYLYILKSPRKSHEIRPIYFTREKMLPITSGESLFCSAGKPVGSVKIENGTATFRSLANNSGRVTLFRSSGTFGLAIYYYVDDVEHFFISNGNHFLRIQRDEIPPIRKAMRKFTRTARPDLTRKPGKQFTEYGPPP
jgi:hypothetical protein